MSRAGIPFLICCLVMASAASAIMTDELGRTVFYAEDLRQAGVTRPAEIMLLVEDWRPTTMDGVSWRGSLSGLGHYDGQQWQVMVDGKPIAINLFATGALNRLPISMTQIDSIEVITLPRIHHGRLVDTGMIHFHTITPKVGLSGSGRVMAGNETGEPGPYQFTELATPNVERIGPDYSVDIAGAGSRGFARGSYTALRGYAVDDATIRRNDFMIGGKDPSLHIDGLALRGGLNVMNTRHDVLIGTSTFDDFYFLKPYGREVPVESSSLHATASGELTINSRRTVCYRIGYAENRLEERANALDIDFDWQQRQASVDVELEHTGDRYRVTGGIGIRTFHVETAYGLDRARHSNARAYVDVGFGSESRLHHQVGAVLLAGEDDVAISGAWHLQWTTRERGRGQIIAAYTERIPEMDDRIWYWQERGYEFLADNGVDVTRTGEMGVGRRLSLDIIWRRAHRSWTLEGRLFYRMLANQQVERQRFQYQPFDKSFIGPVTVDSNQRGEVAGGKLALEYANAAGIRGRMSYSLQETVAGDDAFTSAWDAVASHHAQIRFGYEVNRKFGVWALLNYWSATQWHDYTDVEAQSDGEYTVALGDIFLLDVGFDKWFWNERLRGNILFRNALDRNVRFHPIGASFDLSVFVQIELLLGMPRP